MGFIINITIVCRRLLGRDRSVVAESAETLPVYQDTSRIICIESERERDYHPERLHQLLVFCRLGSWKLLSRQLD